MLARRSLRRRDARGFVRHPHLRRLWVLDDEVEDELHEGMEILQELFNSEFLCVGEEWAGGLRGLPVLDACSAVRL